LKTLHDELFAPWFSDEDRRRWAIELLNLCLKQYCWERYLRFDKKGQRFFFRPILRMARRSAGKLGIRCTHGRSRRGIMRISKTRVAFRSNSRSAGGTKLCD
jgi:hypothetical protein